MFDFSEIDRRSTRFEHRVPERFNFARDVVDSRAAQADKVALRYLPDHGADVVDIAYSELARASDEICGGLQQRGITAGAHALILVSREPAWHEIMLGCMKAGVVSIPSTVLLTPRDIITRINRTGASIVFATPELADRVEAARASCPTLRHVILCRGEREGWTSLKSLRDATVGVPVDTRATDPMLLYFTSGTTSAPKMVVHDHAYGLAHAITGLFWMDLDETSVHWVMTDTGWAKAAWGMMFPQLLLGATMFVLDGGIGFEPERLLPLFEKHGVTSFCAPPTVYRMFAQSDLSAYRFPALRRSISAGEPMNPEAIRAWQNATGTLIADGYGQTETINLVANLVGIDQKVGSMGVPMPGLDVDVVDEAGARAGADTIGQIAVRVTDPWPPGLFHGYQTKDGANTDAFRHGWYYSGDTARRDADGYFWFVGRADDVILSAAYRISPFEVESTLLEHPAIMESAVVGAPDPVRGQIVVAFVVLADGWQPDETLTKDIQSFCKQQSAPYKYPRMIRYRDSLPKTISGKIRRVELRQSLSDGDNTVI